MKWKYSAPASRGERWLCLGLAAAGVVLLVMAFRSMSAGDLGSVLIDLPLALVSLAGAASFVVSRRD